MNKPAIKILKRILAILVIAVLISAVIAVYANDTHADDVSIIRVKLTVGTPSSFSFSLSGNYGIENDAGAQLSTGTYTARVEGAAVCLYRGDTLIASGPSIKVVQQSPPSGQYNYASIRTTRYGTNKYLGDILLKCDGTHIDVINHIYLEDYLYGVVPHEMSNSWPLEALKAQAVAARTYAARYMGGGSYDVVDTPANQAYKGYNENYTNAIRAVDETAKTVLVCDGSLAQTFYTASNGGYTDIPQHLWSASATLRPYHIIQEDPFDTQNAWSMEEVLIFPKAVTADTPIDYQYMSSGDMVSGSGSEISNAARYLKVSALPQVAAQGYIAGVTGDIEIAGITSIVPHTHQGQHGLNDYSGSNACVCFTHADVSMNVLAYRYATDEERAQTGETMVREQVAVSFTIDMHAFDDMDGRYRAFNNASLRLFVVSETDNDWRIYHRRYGHGVGMSQRGAQERAKAGQTFEDILSFYYPGTYFEALNITRPDLGDMPPGEDTTNAQIVNCNVYVNVRSTPSTEYPAIGRALAGSRITVTEANAAPDWHRINYGGVDAYICAYYVQCDPEPTATPTETPTTTPTATPTTAPITAPTAVPITAPTAMPTTVPTTEPTVTPTTAPTATPTDAVAQIGTVHVGVLNIRSGPDTSYSKLGQFAYGDVVQVIAANFTAEWHQIRYHGTAAYVFAAYVSLSDAAPAIEAEGVITSSVLNIRSGPGTSYSKIGQLGKGDTVDIIALNYTDDWHQILHGGGVAYVHADYVNTDGSADAGNVYASVNAGALNFRSAASLGSTVIDTLSRGDVVQVLEQGTLWHKVRCGGRDGYMYAQYLKISSSVYGQVTAGALNVRSGASTETTICGRLGRGDIVEVIAQGTLWHKIRYGASTAYVYAAYVEIQ